MTEPPDEAPKAVLPEPGDPHTLTVMDLSGYVFRAYHALPPLSTARGEPTHAVLGVTSMLQKLLAEQKPAYFAVAVDARGPSFRKALFAEYKATRRATPPDLHPQAEHVTAIARAYGIPCLEAEGFEADDVIATLVRYAKDNGLDVVIASADKDLLQLVGDGVVMHDSMRDLVYGPTETRAKLGIPPEKVRDYLALVGDSSDNVPGVPKVGPKTAVELLDRFGDYDGIFAHVSEITKPALKLTLTENKALGDLSRTLVSLREDAPVELDLEKLKVGGADLPALRAIFRELEMDRALDVLERSLGGGSAEEPLPPVRPKPAPLPAVTPQVVSSRAELESVLAEARASDAVAIETLLEGDDARRSPIVGVSLGWREGAAYVPLGHVYLGRPDQLPPREAFEVLAAFAGGTRPRLAVHDAKREVMIWARESANLTLLDTDVDTMLASYLLRADERANTVEDVARSELDLVLDPVASILPKSRAARGRLSEIEVERTAAFAAPRVRALIQASGAQLTLLEDEKLEGVYRELELPLARVLAGIEETGVRIDVLQLSSTSRTYDVRIRELEKKCHELAGHEFQLASPRALEVVLFDELGLPVVKRTKTARSTDADVLEELAPQHPLPREIMAWRQLTKLKSTYLDALPSAIDPATGRVHTRFNQAVAATGRLSSSDPNLQNIPIRTEEGRLIREAFIAADGFSILSADYSQIELRVLAHMSSDPELISAFSEDADVHVRTATALFYVAADLVTKEQRGQAKTVNFAVIYGQSEVALARNLGIEQKEARRYIQAFFQRYSGVARYLDGVVADARRTGAVRTMLGRKRTVPGLDSRNRTERWAAERIARNTPIQGTAADIIKRAMVDLELALRARDAKSRMILTVHDELVLELHESEVATLPALVKSTMENAVELRVPLLVETGIGKSWGQAH